MNSMSFTAFIKLVRPSVPWICACFVATSMAEGGVFVPVAPALVKSVGSAFELDGVIQPVKQSIISAQSSGRITSLAVKAGDKVRVGQFLATIDDKESQTGLQRSQAQVAQAQAELRNAQANFDRTRELQTKGFVSSSALDVAESQFKAALAGRDQASAAARQSVISQGFTRVAAPFDGWVLQTFVDVGDLAVPGKPLLTLYAPIPLRVVVQIPLSRLARANVAGVAEVLLPSEDGALRWTRPIATSAVPTADAISQTMEWRLELSPLAAKTLLPGQQVRVRFGGVSMNRMLVPASAVLHRGELTAVYVETNKGFVLKAVRLGIDHGAEGVEVVAGLMAGDKVALDPVKAGMAGAKATSSATTQQAISPATGK